MNNRARGVRCVAYGCNNTTLNNVSMHRFPLDQPIILKQWNSFVRSKRKDWKQPSKYSTLCSDHFTEDSYPIKYRIMGSMGQLSKKRKLEKFAIPTIHASFTVNTAKRSSSECDQVSRRPKKIRMAAIKRENKRLIEKCEVSKKEVLQAVTTETKENQQKVSENIVIDVETEFERTVPEIENHFSNVRSIGSQCLRRRKNYKSHYVQTRFVGKNKGVQTCPPSFADVGVTCHLLPTPTIHTPPQEDSQESFDFQPGDCSTPEHHYDSDPSFRLSESELQGEEDDDSFESLDSRGEKKYIVYETKLLQLFSNCPECAKATTSFIKGERGSMITVEQECFFCKFNRTWFSQPCIGNIPAGNLAMSSAMLFSGLMPTKLLRFMTFMNLNSIKLSTFMVHQASYLQPSIYQLWEKKQRSYFEKGVQRGSPICVAGDGRCDSMGHCAKYCTYTIMDVEEGIIIDIQLVQSNEVKSSVHMEKEGLSRCIETLKSKGLTVCNIITGRHVQVKKWVKDNMPETKHSVDVWHVAKGLKKKLMKLSKEKDCSDITPWIKSITNHMYWVASSTPDACKELMWEKWSSLGNHIQDVHFGHGLVFKNCCHAELTERSKKKKWLKSGSKACEKLNDLILGRQMKIDIPMLSTSYQTSDLESFHSVLNHFAPKMVGLSFNGMLTRVFLAALHFNENASRGIATNEDGKEQISISYPKAKNGEYTVRKIKKAASFDYVDELIKIVFLKAESTNMKDAEKLPIPPPPLCSSYSRPSKEEALNSLISRYR